MCSILEAVQSLGPRIYQVSHEPYTPPHAKTKPPEIKL